MGQRSIYQDEILIPLYCKVHQFPMHVNFCVCARSEIKNVGGIIIEYTKVLNLFKMLINDNNF